MAYSNYNSPKTLQMLKHKLKLFHGINSNIPVKHNRNLNLYETKKRRIETKDLKQIKVCVSQ